MSCLMQMMDWSKEMWGTLLSLPEADVLQGVPCRRPGTLHTRVASAFLPCVRTR